MTSKNAVTNSTATDHSISSENRIVDALAMFFRSLDPRYQRMEMIKIITNDRQSLLDAFAST